MRPDFLWGAYDDTVLFHALLYILFWILKKKSVSIWSFSFLFHELSISTISLNHYLCINSPKSVKTKDLTTSVHPPVCDGLIFGFKLTGFMIQPNNRVSMASFFRRIPWTRRVILSQLFSYILLWNSTMIILTRTLFLVEPKLCVCRTVSAHPDSWARLFQFFRDRHLTSTWLCWTHLLPSLIFYKKTICLIHLPRRSRRQATLQD